MNHPKITHLLIFVSFLSICFFNGAVLYSQEQFPLPIDYSKTAYFRMLQKPVFDSLKINSMESLDKLELEGPGNFELENKIVKEGKYSVRINVPTRTKEEPTPPGKRRYEGSAFSIDINNANWSDYNRLSLWVHPILEGWFTVDFRMILHNDGEIKVPGYEYPVYNSVLLKNKQWNHVVWELADLPRDKVDKIEIQIRRQGNEPEANNQLVYIIDDLSLEKVEEDHYKGWDVADGQIAYSHSGYQLNSRKIAIVNQPNATRFKIIDQKSGMIAFEGPVKVVESPIGSFQVMDFSSLTKEGLYSISLENLNTKPFVISDYAWESSIWKSINFFYCERCGIEIPGVHRVCHGDWQLKNGDESIICNGGWHDAGDLSQGIINTSEAVSTFLSLAERLRENNENQELAEHLIEEAEWGLDWVLRTTFHNGYRFVWATMGLWTDGILGNNDDISAEAVKTPGISLYAVIAEAVAARILKEKNPNKAKYAAKMANEDFNFALEGLKDMNKVSLFDASLAADAAIEMYRLTGNKEYTDIAFQYANHILKCQQIELLSELNKPITGFFYTDTSHKRMVHQVHGGQEEDPIIVLTKLCELFPEHPDWMKWYGSVAVYSDYFQKQMSKFTFPYNFLPNSLYCLDEVNDFAPENQKNVKEQISNGFNVGGDYFVRMFPVNPNSTFRGNYNTVLSQTKALSVASQLRKNPELLRLCDDQLHWIVGLNPFTQSAMYGEGYNCSSLYSPMSGNIVGALPVGLKSLGNEDIPYWPNHCFANYKEVWVHPVCRWLWIMEDLYGSSTVKGRIIDLPFSTVRFEESNTGNIIEVQPDFSTGVFNAKLPFGEYIAIAGDFRKKFTCMPGENLELNVENKFISLEQLSWTQENGKIKFAVNISGNGKHHLKCYTQNLKIEKSEKNIELKANGPQNIFFQVKVENKNAPWVFLVVPDNDFSSKKEACGVD